MEKIGKYWYPSCGQPVSLKGYPFSRNSCIMHETTCPKCKEVITPKYPKPNSEAVRQNNKR